MTRTAVGTARGILRNVAALFLVGLFAKGAGLLISVLVARFLGADAMGLFAVLFSVSVLIETFITLGMSDSVVRDVAARTDDAPGMYVGALKLVGMISLLPTAGLLVAAGLNAGQPVVSGCLLILAFGTPVSGAFVVAQAVLQGSERVLLLTWVTFVSRVISIAFLVWLFFDGAGLAAAFLSRVLFHLLALAVFSGVILRRREAGRSSHSPHRLFMRAVPFAANLALRELGRRLPSLVLPGVIGLAPSGLFDAANRLRSTLGVTMTASIRGLMPAFARSPGDPEEQAGRLIGFSVKYMCVGMALVATVITVLAPWIVRLLYGPGFAQSVLPLQLLVWAQVLISVDAVLQQAMLARQAVMPAVRHTATGVALQGALLVLLSWQFGLQGAGFAVILAATAVLSLDLRYVTRNVSRFPTWIFVGAPLAAIACVATLTLATDRLALPMHAVVALGGWAAAVAVFRFLPMEDLRFMWRLITPSRRKLAAAP